MTLVFFLGVGAYLIVMALVGYLSSRRIKTMDDYLTAGRSLPLYLAVPTVIATWYGAGATLGVSGTVYSQGFYGVLPDPFGCSLGLLIAGLFFAAPFRRLRLRTISDLLKNVYGQEFEFASTLIVIPFYVGTLAAQMLAIGYAFQIISGMSMEWGIFLGGGVVILYTVSGGMWAVTITDFFQFIILTIGLAIVVPICLEQIPDPQLVLNNFWHEFTTLTPKEPASIDWLAYIGRILMTALGAIMGQDLIQRLIACRTEAIARYSSFIGAIGYFLLGFIPLFIGLAGREIYPDLANPEHLIPKLAKEFLSPAMFTLFACGLLSAIMSTADSYLLAGTTLLTNNVLLKLWPLSTDKKKIRLLRIVNITLALLAIGLSFSGHSIFDLMVHSGATLFVAIFVPATAALYWKGASSFAAWSSVACGILSWLGYIFMNLHRYPEGHEDLLFAAATLGASFSLAGYVAASLLKYYLFTHRRRHASETL